MNKLLRKTLFWYDGLWPRKPVKPPYRHVNQIGDPILRSKSEPVPLAAITSVDIKKVISAMKHVMKEYDCIGLAAPQIGVNKRIIIIEFNDNHLKCCSEETIKRQQVFVFPQMVFINPVMKIINMNKVTFEEGCESVRGFCAEVPRFQEVQVSGYNEEGQEVITNFNGWASRIVQHEIDHLDGKFYTDIMDKNTFHCTLWAQVNKYGGKIKMPYTPI